MREKVSVFQLLDMDEPIASQNVLIGTINDLRKYAKDWWKIDSTFVIVMNGEDILEEDFYAKMDDDSALIKFLNSAGYSIREICKVPLADFYDEEKPTQELIDEVLSQIKVDIAGGDMTALDEMLKAMSVQSLIGYLPEK